ncbi:MAG: acetyltransferase, partial [Gammaproteobacteria bacterium]|nr:acetyltransferase [Gammaproteobacteria bacterium]
HRNQNSSDPQPIIIVGIGETADIAHEYFSVDEQYDVVAFSVSAEYKKTDTYQNKPLIALENLSDVFPSDQYKVFVALSSGRLNRDRQSMYDQIKQQGYSCVSYISPRAFVWRTASIGENCFIFENVTIQHGVSIGNNVTVWSNSCIAHQSEVGDHVFIAPGCMICGYAKIGSFCFIGANTVFADHATIGDNSFVGMGSVISKTIASHAFVRPAKPFVVPFDRHFLEDRS